MYGALILDSLCSISNPIFCMSAITSSSVSSTLPGSAIPRVHYEQGQLRGADIRRTYL
jgi:hypothetical protein